METKLPTGCRASLVFYYTSDKDGVDITLGLSNLNYLPDLSDANPAGAINKLPTIADDWRVMTDDEVRTYIAQEREDGDHGEEVEF